jgi:hypothetical protein
MKSWLLLFPLLCSITFGVLADPVGQVGYVRGIVSATGPDGDLRLLNRGGDIFAGDSLQTGRDSFAVLRFIDDTRLSLRPQTEFRVDEYQYANSDKDDRGFFSLLKGGFRALAGFISKSRPNALKVTTTTATIGVRGTEFDARLCEADECGAEASARSSADKRPGESLVVGRVAFRRGELIAISEAKNTSRQVYRGGPVYEGDRLITGADDFAVIAFSDQSRVTLMSHSQLLVEKFKYDPEKKEHSSSLLNLLKGGIRAVTGLIASFNRNRVKFKTVNATIGVRGTGFDIICDGMCETTRGGGPMNVNVWDGSIFVEQPGRQTVVDAGQTAVISDRFEAPEVRPSADGDSDGLPTRPDQIDIDFDDLFGRSTMSSASPEAGLYVSVYDGHVSVENNSDGRSVDIGAGEAAFSGVSGVVQRLDRMPEFQINDTTPGPGDLSPEIENSMQLIFDGGSYSVNGLECSIN